MKSILHASSTGLIHASIVLGTAWLLCTCVTSLRRGRASLFVRLSLVAAILLSILAFLPIPGFSTSVATSTARMWPTRRAELSDSNSPTHHNSEQGNQLAISNLQFISNSPEASQVTQKPSSSWPTWLLLAIPLVLMGRHTIGLLSILWLTRNSELIEESRCQGQLAELLERDQQLAVDLRSTSLLSAAATTGWFRPVILLPETHSTWSDIELRAVLAHEVAHIRNRDFAWRWIAGLFAAFQCVNPLAHWLCRRMTLEQEVEADRVASESIGCRKIYARILSELAIRADSDRTPVSLPGLLSMNSSTHLFRRIEMLRAKEGSKNTYEPLVRIVGVVMLTVVTLVASGLRAAEQSSASPTTTKRSQTLTPFDVNQLPVDTHGAFVVRPSLLVDENVCEYGPMIGRLWEEGCKDAAFPKIDLSKIAYIAGNLKVQVRHVGETIEPNDEDKDEHQLIMSMDTIFIRTHEPLDLVRLLKDRFPSIEEIDPAKRVFELPPLAVFAFGPGPLQIRVLDDSNLAISFTKEGHDWLANHQVLPRTEKSWKSAWSASDTGAFTVLVQPDLVPWPTLEHQADPIKELVKKTMFAAASISSNARTLTLDLVARDSKNESGLGQVEQAIATFAEEAKKYFSKKPAKDEDRDFLAGWFEKASSERVLEPVPAIRLSGPVSFDSPTDTGEAQIAKPAKASDLDQVQLHFALIEVDRQKLQQLKMPFSQSGDQKSGIVKEAFPTNARLIAALSRWLNQDVEAGRQFLNKLRTKQVAKSLAEPVITTVSGRKAGFDDGANRLFFTPEVTDHGQILVTLDSGEPDATNLWFKTLSLTAGKTYSFVKSATANAKDPLEVLQLRAEFIAAGVPSKLKPIERSAKVPASSTYQRR